MSVQNHGTLDFRAAIGLARIAMLNSDLDLALESWTKSIEQMPRFLEPHMEDLDPRVGRAGCLYDMHRFSECRKYAHELSIDRSSDPRPLFLLARLDMAEGNFKCALKVWDKILSGFPDSIDAFIGRINCYLLTDHFEEAAHSIRAASSIWPGAERLQILEARLAVKKCEYENSRVILLDLLKNHSSGVVVYSLLWQSLLGLGKIDEFQNVIDQAPTEIQHSEQFILDVLIPYYVTTQNWEAFRLCSVAYSEKFQSPRQAGIWARYLFLRSELDDLVDFIEPVIRRFPYALSLYQLLMRAYQQTGRRKELIELKKAMISQFGVATVYPTLIQMGPNFIGDDFPEIFKWLIENPDIKAQYFSELLDCLIISGEDHDISMLVDEFRKNLSPVDRVRVAGADCQTRDRSLLNLSLSYPVEWSEFQNNFDRLNLHLNGAFSSVISQDDSAAELKSFYENYLHAISQYKVAYMHSRESYYCAVSIVEQLVRRINDGVPTSLIRLGDGEGNFLPYRADLRGKARQDQQASQKIWWHECLIDRRDSTNLGDRLVDAARNADFIGIPPLWRVIRRIFRNGKVSLEGNENRGNLATIDLISSDKIDRQKILLSSVVTNDLARWDLYQSLLVVVNSVSYISCHDLDAFLKRKYGLESRQRLFLPPEHTYRQMFEMGYTQSDRGMDKVQRIYPDIFEIISRDIHPKPGELYLVAAGFLGKFFCDIIKRRGGIGIDIGSAADYWMGYETRPFRQTEFDFDPTISMIEGMPLKNFILNYTPRATLGR